MPLSLRIPPKKEAVITKAAIKAGKTKSAYILDAVDEKLGLVNDREKTIRELAGWLSHDEAEDGIRDLIVTGVPDVCSSDLVCKGSRATL